MVGLMQMSISEMMNDLTTLAAERRCRLAIMAAMMIADIVNNNTKIPCLVRLQEGISLCWIQVQETLVDIDNKLLTKSKRDKSTIIDQLKVHGAFHPIKGTMKCINNS